MNISYICWQHIILRVLNTHRDREEDTGIDRMQELNRHASMQTTKEDLEASSIADTRRLPRVPA
ncbi:hypothetical protein PUN28_001881 [Cardiocondyla obscurior]|uniref:Uncharacterized protein n=1 Tax=Cardiocondyla obscurior TaxID=286306 RepID=A0AAW2GRQ3_9HYME